MGAMARWCATDWRTVAGVDLKREAADWAAEAFVTKDVPKFLDGVLNLGAEVLGAVLGLKVAFELGVIVAFIEGDHIVSRGKGVGRFDEGFPVLLEQPVSVLQEVRAKVGWLVK